MNLTKTTNGEDFVLAIDKNEPGTFVLAINEDEIKLIGLALEQFGGNRIYDAALRVNATDLSSAMWERQRLLAAAEQYKLDQENEQKGEDHDEPSPDWTKQ